MSLSTETGTVIAAHGRHYLIQLGAEKLQCVTRGKNSMNAMNVCLKTVYQ